MFFLETFIIIILIFFQSIFGIGLLLFGTPTFLLIGYNFLDVLNILLPISITISAIQIFSSKVENKKFKYNFNFFCLPFLIPSLYFIINNLSKINLEILISIFIILLSILALNKNKIKYINNLSLFKQRIIFITIGIVHGLTNISGPLLAILSSTINKDDKKMTRFCIAYAYLVMGILQILVLYLFSDSRINTVNLLYIFLVFLIYIPTQKIFNKIKGKKFSNLLNVIALFYGVIILVKNT